MQVLPLVVPCGADGQLLCATFKNASTFAFQDSMGESLFSIASVVPDGLLVFLSSYGMLDKLSARWKDTGDAPSGVQCFFFSRNLG